MSNTQLLFLYLTKPREAIRLILENPPHLLVLSLFILAMLNSQIFSGYSDLMTSSSASLYLSVGLLLKIAIFFFGLLLISAIIHFVSDLVGCAGSVSGLFTAFLFSYVPYLFLGPVTFFPKTISVICSVFLLVWVIVLQVKSIQEVYRLPSFKAIVIYLTPFVFLVLLVPLFLIASLLFTFALALTMIPAV